MEFGLAIQIMVVLVYWPLVHPEVMKEVIPSGDDVVYWIMIIIHSWPFMAVLVNVILTRIVFIYDHYLYCFYLGVVYICINFVGTKMRGKPMYAFLNW